MDMTESVYLDICSREKYLDKTYRYENIEEDYRRDIQESNPFYIDEIGIRLYLTINWKLISKKLKEKK